MNAPLVASAGLADEEGDGGARGAVPAAAIWMVLLTVFLDQFGNNVVVPMLAPYARKDFHASDGEIGYLFSFPCLAAVLFSSVLARVTTVFGRKPMFIMSLFGMSVATLCQGVAGSFSWLLFGRTFGGLWLNTMTTARVYINESTDWDVTGNDRSYWFAQFSLAQNVAKLFAPALGGALSHYGLNVPSLATSVVNLVGAVLVYFYVVESPRFLAGAAGKREGATTGAAASAKPPAAAGAMPQLLRMRLFCLAGMLTTACMKLSQTIFAIFAIDKYGLGTIDIGFCFLLGALGTIVASRFVPPMNRRWGPYRSAIAMSSVHGASMVLLPLFPVPSLQGDSVDLAWRASLVCMVSCFVVMSATSTIALSFQSIISGELDNQPLVQTRAFQFRQAGQFLLPIAASRIFQVDMAYPWLLGAMVAFAAAVPVHYLMPPGPPSARLERQTSGYGDSFQDEKLSEAEVRELGMFVSKVLVQKHLKWVKDREHVEKILMRSIPEMPITDRETYYEALIQYAT